MFGCSVALLPRCGCCVLCFVVLTLRVWTSLAPRLAGFTVPARSTRVKSHGRTFLTWCSGQYSCPAWGAASFVGACRSVLSQVLTLWGRRSPFSFWLRMPGHEGAVPGSRYHRWRVPWVGCTRAVAPYLLCEVLAVILVLWVALRLRSLLRGSCFGTVVPWGLASFYRVCGGDAGLVLPGPARLVGSLLQSWCLVLGPGCLVCRLPSVSFPWVGSTVGFLGSVSTS